MFFYYFIKIIILKKLLANYNISQSLQSWAARGPMGRPVRSRVFIDQLVLQFVISSTVPYCSTVRIQVWRRARRRAGQVFEEVHRFGIFVCWLSKDHTTCCVLPLPKGEIFELARSVPPKNLLAPLQVSLAKIYSYNCLFMWNPGNPWACKNGMHQAQCSIINENL